MNSKYNDIQRIFYEDSRVKKRIGIGVHSRASRLGYIRGGMKTASDFLTARERKQLNGEVRSYNMYEEFKNLDNCNLDEILKKSDLEVKGILTMIKENNTCAAICSKLNISNGKLYALYDKYNVLFEKKPRKKAALPDKSKIIEIDKFKELNSFDKGMYLKNLSAEFTYKELAELHNISKNMVGYYIKTTNDKLKKGNKVEESSSVSENTNVLNCDNDIITELKNIITELKNENSKLIESISNADNKKDENLPGLRFDVNGIYTKDELSSRLLSIDNITMDSYLYKISIHIEEASKIVNLDTANDMLPGSNLNDNVV